MQVGTTKDQGLYNKPSAAVHPGPLAATIQYNSDVSGQAIGPNLRIQESITKYLLYVLSLRSGECSLCLAVTQVRIPSITERLSPAALTTSLPSIQPFATTLLADTTLLRIFTAPAFPYINSTLGLHAFFWILKT